MKPERPMEKRSNLENFSFTVFNAMTRFILPLSCIGWGLKV